MDKDKVIHELVKKVEKLTARVMQLEFFEEENKKLREETQLLRKENKELRADLEKFKHPKNSRNSSIPPSKDENRPKKNKSLREKGTKKSGGQHGHEGRTLMMTDTPDKIIFHIPDVCGCCGKSLKSISGEL